MEGASACSSLLEDQCWRQTPHDRRGWKWVKMCNNEDKFSGSQREQATCSASHQLPGGWQKMNRNHGWLIWVSYSQQHYSAVGSAWISLSLALCPASIQFTGNEHLLPLPKVRLWVFRPGCSVWTFFFLREAQAIIVVAPGSKASCFGWQRQGKAIKLFHPLDWFTVSPSTCRQPTTCSELNLWALKSTPWRRSHQVKILLLSISLYQLGAKHASTLSFIHCGVQLWQLFPSFPKCWWEDVLTFSFVLPFPSLFLVQKLNIQHLQLPAV